MTEEKKRVTIKSLTEELNVLKEKVKKVDILEEQMNELKDIIELLLMGRNLENVKNYKVQPHSSFNFNCSLSVCARGFVTKYVLNKHIKEEHRQNLRCEICDGTSDKNCVLETHIEEHAK